MSASSTKSPLLSDSNYNKLKHVASTGLPALATLYFGLSQIWNLPDTPEVVATITAVNVACGVLLGYSSASYNASDSKYAGVIEIVEDEAKKVFSLNLHQDPATLEKMATATFRVASGVQTVPAAQSGFAEPQNPPVIGG